MIEKDIRTITIITSAWAEHWQASNRYGCQEMIFIRKAPKTKRNMEVGLTFDWGIYGALKKDADR